MRTKPRTFGAAAMALAVLGLAACGSSGGGGGSAKADSAPGVSAKSITISSTVASTGNFAAVTGPYIAAAQAYFKKINQSGGVHGRSIEWNYTDDGYNSQRAVAGAQKIAQQDSSFIAALPFGTATTIAAAQVYSSAGVPFVSLGTSLEELQGKNAATTFGCTASYYDQTRAAIQWASQNMPAGTWASLTYSTGDGADVAKGLTDEAAADHLNVVKAVTYNAGSTDFSGELTTLKMAGAKYVVLFGSTPDSARIVTAAKAAGLDATFVGPMPLADPAFLSLAKGAAEGTIVGSPYLPLTSDAQGIQQFKQVLQQYGGSGAQPTMWALHGYNCATIVAEGLKLAGANPTRASFIKGMESIKNFDNGVAAPVTYGPNDHAASHSAVVLEVQNGAFVQKSSGWISFDK